MTQIEHVTAEITFAYLRRSKKCLAGWYNIYLKVLFGYTFIFSVICYLHQVSVVTPRNLKGFKKEHFLETNAEMKILLCTKGDHISYESRGTKNKI